MPDPVKICMLGGFSIEKNGVSVDDNSNRMRKVWLLLAYLIHSRNRRISQDNYLSLLQSSGDEDSADPTGKLKTMFFRVRSMLKQVDEDAGHDWIIRKNGTYTWNPEVPAVLDAEEFEALCSDAESTEDDDVRLDICLRAIDLYKGDFLPKLSTESWVMPLSAYYHRLYLTVADSAICTLMERSDWTSATELCRRVLKIEPYSETFYQHLMRCRIANNDRAAALAAYEEMSDILFSTFGVMPSDESRDLYRTAARESGLTTLPVYSLREMLREPVPAKGALFCEYDFFRMMYQVQARSIARSGDTIHIAMLSVGGSRNKDLSRRSLDIAMDNLKEIIVGDLRQGDIVTKASVSQFIVMLPQANYENSCMVCKRIIKGFFRKYPHSPADINFIVQPLEPLESRPRVK